MESLGGLYVVLVAGGVVVSLAAVAVVCLWSARWRRRALARMESER
ncbi:hypothetical protein [Streptomyces sp. NPDC003023]